MISIIFWAGMSLGSQTVGRNEGEQRAIEAFETHLHQVPEDARARVLLAGAYAADERVDQYDSDTFFTICNYEQVLRDHSTIAQVA